MSRTEREAVLEAENDRLRARVADLEALLFAADGWRAPPDWGLTASEARIAGVLIARELASRNMIMAALYRDDAKDEPDPKVVGVFVCKLRRKLKPFGIVIETVWGEGWRLAAAHRAALRQGAVMMPPEGARHG